MSTKDIEISWAGGFIEGEGNFSICFDNRKGQKTQGVRTQIQACSVDKCSLERLQRAVGGNIYGPYHRKVVHKPVWVWNVPARQQADVARELTPYLEAKKRRAEILIKARALIGARRGKHRGNQHTGIEYDAYPEIMFALYREITRLNRRGSGKV